MMHNLDLRCDGDGAALREAAVAPREVAAMVQHRGRWRQWCSIEGGGDVEGGWKNWAA
jgi:hypothetical protein